MLTITIFESPVQFLDKARRRERLDIDLFEIDAKAVQVVRYNTIDHLQEFTRHALVSSEWEQKAERLPIILIDDQVVGRAAYPSYKQLCVWTGISPVKTGGCGGGGECRCG